jgi:hypothetical protein
MSIIRTVAEVWERFRLASDERKAYVKVGHPCGWTERVPRAVYEKQHPWDAIERNRRGHLNLWERIQVAILDRRADRCLYVNVHHPCGISERVPKSGAALQRSFHKWSALMEQRNAIIDRGADAEIVVRHNGWEERVPLKDYERRLAEEEIRAATDRREVDRSKVGEPVRLAPAPATGSQPRKRKNWWP